MLFLPHSLRQMLRPARMINRLEVRQVIAHGDVIEDYPNDPRGHSCLMFWDWVTEDARCMSAVRPRRTTWQS